MSKHLRCYLWFLAIACVEGCGSAATGGGGGGGKGITFTISGEALALGGYAFPPASKDDVAFVDGWDVRFTRVLVTVDHLTLSQNPDKVPTDQSQTDAVVAHWNGPWAVELHKGGPLEGKGGGDEQAVALLTVTTQNDNGNAAFALDDRYAFGFDAVAAAASAKNVNLDAADLLAYKELVAAGQSILIEGVATWKGTQTSCKASAPYDFGALPKVVKFKFGLKMPTTYANCQNPDNAPAKAFAGEENQRGIAVKANDYAVAQLTFHTDHFFWQAVQHDAAAHFDAFAAKFAGKGDSVSATMQDYVGQSIAPVTDGNGKAVPWRWCVDDFTPPKGEKMTYETGGILINPAGNSATDITDFADYVRYNASTLGHLNSDGLCYVKRNYPSPQ